MHEEKYSINKIIPCVCNDTRKKVILAILDVYKFMNFKRIRIIKLLLMFNI